ncbi:hypothetical protein [Methylobacterium aquaticum]|jgi:hypothetical protein|uniref:hypothetical protein n=1 Tax=Methylobacterium aquaticum TaxID=270351 RepID=UPI000AE7DF7C|nr:hypothetical protein [Methylobacterium aquaticum]
MPNRIAPAAEYQFGRVCQLVVAATLQVIRDEKEPTALLQGHFALADTTTDSGPGTTTS